MKILHLTDRLTTRGGAHRHLLGIADALVAAGEEVTLAAGRDEGADVPCATHIVPGLEARDAAGVDLERLAEAVQPDIVHLHTVVNPVALEWGGRRGAFITVQDHRYFCPGRGKWTRGGDVCRDGMSADLCASCFDEPAYFEDTFALTRRRLEAVRGMRVIVLSRYMRGEMVQVGLPEATLHVIPPFVHGLDLDATADGDPCVLFVGRLTAHKGVLDAVAAWRRADTGLPLVAAGTGPLRTELENAGVQVLGWLEPRALSRVYRRARALLFPPRWQEPYGIVGVEALAMGVPVAAWESGGIAEWHPGPLPPWGDVDGLADALRVAVARPMMPAARGESREVLMSRLLELYRQALS